VPELFSYVQTETDKDGRAGRFILTGSESMLLMEKISQSLAGRCAVLHLLPFSRAELERQVQPPPQPPPQLFSNRATECECWNAIRTGFYPRIHDRRIPPEIWLSDYVRTYAERDVRRLVNVGDTETFERFLALCAGRTGQLLNFSALASDSGIAVDTARRWISILKTGFIVFLLRPHHRNFNKRVIKSPKLYFHDTGLACQLLGIRNEEQLVTHPARGALFENYVISEVVKAYTHHRREPPVYFWRDQSGHEIDLLVEEAGVLFPVEIKSGATVSRSMFDGLNWWNKLTAQAPQPATLVYGGMDTFSQKEISVCPWFAI
jgi:predicted AAA+ superfamily ATPase